MATKVAAGEVMSMTEKYAIAVIKIPNNVAKALIILAAF